MKMKKINILLSVALGAIVAFTSCKKDDGAIPNRVTTEKVPAISTAKDVANDTIRVATQATFTAKFTVSNYFAGMVPTKIDIAVRKNNTATAVNNNNVKVYKANAATAYPTQFTFTGAELVALFGANGVNNDYYDFGVDIYYGDKKYEAFPAGVSGTGAGVAQMPLFSETARYYVKN